MEQPNPATPAQAATPGTNGQAPANPAATPNPTGAGDRKPQEEPTTTISQKRLSELTRAEARLKAKQKREDLSKKRASQPSDGDGTDDDLSSEERDELNRLRESDAEKDIKLLQVEIKGQVRDLLAKSEYARLPESTKNLILKNPSSLSDADSAEEAMIDIEEFLMDEVAKLPPEDKGQPGQPNSPAGHETPSAPGAGAPAHPANDQIEDVSNLTGPARSRAILRNKIIESRRGGAK